LCRPVAGAASASPCSLSPPFFVQMTPLPPRSTLFPYTTLFRSVVGLITEWVDSEGNVEERTETSDLGGTMRLGSQLCHLAKGSKDRKSTRLNSSHVKISYAVFCLKKKTKYITTISVGIPGRNIQ